MAQALGGTVAPHRPARVRPARRCVVAPSPARCSRGLPGRPAGVDVATATRSSAAPAGFTVTADDGRRAGRRLRGPRPAAAPACSSTRRCCTPSTARQVLEHFLLRHRRARRRPGRRVEHHRRAGGRDPRPGRRPAGRSAGCPAGSTRRSPRRWCTGGRRPAHLRLRRPRPAARGRGRAGRADYVAATGIRLKVVDAAERFLGALAGVTDPEAEAQDHRPASSSGSSRTPRPRSSPSAARTGDGRVPRPGHALPRRGRVRRRHRHREHQEPPQRRRPAGRPAVRAGRAAAHAVQGRGPRGRRSSSACPRRSSGGTRSPGPGLAIRIIGAVDRERLDVLRAGRRRSPARS